MSFLIGNQLILRPVEMSDLDGPYREWINWQQGDIYTEHAQLPHSRVDLERYYRERTTSDQHIWLAIVEKETGVHVGNIEVSNINWVHRKATFSIIVGDLTKQGKGYGFEASMLLIRHVFEKLNLNRLELGVHAENTAARRLYHKLGFKEEGCLRQAFCRNRKFVDIIVMGLLIEDFYALHIS